MMRIRPIMSQTVIKVHPNDNDNDDLNMNMNQDTFNPLDLISQLTGDNSNIIRNVVGNSKPIFTTKVIIRKRG